MSNPTTPLPSPQPTPPSSPGQNQRSLPAGNSNVPAPPELSKINVNTDKRCEALLATQKVLVENSNKVTTFFVDFNDLLGKMNTFVTMVNAVMSSVKRLEDLFSEETVQHIKDIPNMKNRITALEDAQDAPSPTFVTEMQRQLHYSTLGHVYQAKIEACAHRLVINGIPKSSTYLQMSLVSAVNNAVIDKLELRDEIMDFVRPTQVFEVGKDKETSNSFSLMAVFKHPSATYTIFKAIKKVPGGISIIKSVPEEYAPKYKEFRKTQAELRRIKDSNNQQLVKTSIKFENGFMILYYAHFNGTEWGPFKVKDYFFPEFKGFKTPALANKSDDPITHRNMIFFQPQDDEKRQTLIAALVTHEKVMSARFNAKGWSCVVTFKNPVTQEEIDRLLKREEVKEIKG